MFTQILTVIAPVFLIAGLGYLWTRRGGSFDTATIGSLVMYIGSPCLVFSSLTKIHLDGEAFSAVLTASVAVIVGCLAAGSVLLLALRKSLPTFLPSLVHPNTGNMGLPLSLMAFGETGLALAISYYFVNSVSQYTIGMSLSSGRFSPAMLLRQPIIWSVLAALTWRYAGWAVPEFLAGTTQLLGNLVIPAMLLMLGNSLSRLHIADLGTASLLAVARLGLGFGLGLLMIHVLHLEGAAAGVVILQASMPSAVFNYVFAERFGRQPEKVAAVILVSTVLSFATLPLLVGFAIKLAQ
ncbi:MAG: AEC family transporter [Pseudomonadales bacterium]